MISPERKTIAIMLQDKTYKFSVPVYQRNFDWGITQLEELLDDLKDIKDSGNKELFLGSFIFDTSDKSNFKIVDGQQRLTTISIILVAMREHAKKINEGLFAGELQGYVSINSSWSNEKGNKITVSENIRDIFEYISNSEWDGKYPEKISNKSVKRQINKIKPILNYILEEISTYNKEDLQSLAKAVLSSYAIVVNVENTHEIFAIFERTNARGLDLNIGDLLKNYIFAHGIEEFEEKRNEIIENSEGSLQRMLKYFWISRKGHTLQSTLYKNLKSHANDIGINDFVNDLYSFSRYYKIIQSLDSDVVKDWLEEIGLTQLSKNEDYYNTINRVFQALKLFGVTQAYPLIYSIFKFYKDSNSTDYKHLFKILESIENYHFVNNVIAGKIGNKVELFYAENAEKFFHSTEDFIKKIDDFLNALNKKKVNEETFVASFVESISYESKNIALINYVFDRINNFGTKTGQRITIYSPEKDLKKRNFNIEHILPQSNKKDFSTEDQEMFDKIGNLLVLSSHTNSGLQDKTPIEKMKIMSSDAKHYGNLRYLVEFMEEYKKQAEKWDFETIKDRSVKIATDGYKRIRKF